MADVDCSGCGVRFNTERRHAISDCKEITRLKEENAAQAKELVGADRYIQVWVDRWTTKNKRAELAERRLEALEGSNWAELSQQVARSGSVVAYADDLIAEEGE